MLRGSSSDGTRHHPVIKMYQILLNPFIHSSRRILKKTILQTDIPYEIVRTVFDESADDPKSEMENLVEFHGISAE